MCVIIVKTKEGKLPSKQDLKNCFQRNSDGAGFMYCNSKKEVVIDKGYMDFDSFYQRFEKLCKKYNDFKNKNLVMHMRISTAGGVKRENTHPYPICNSIKVMKMLNNTCDIGIAHNGIISIAQPSKEQETNGINDTMVFIRAYLNPIYEDWNECFDNESFLTGIKLLSNSKFAILDKNDKLRIVGDFQEHETVLYSNTSYIGYYSYKAPYKDDYYDKYDDYNYNYTYNPKEFEEYDEKELESMFIELEDEDIVSISDDLPEVKIKDLRTEDGSIFYYNDKLWLLEEISKDGHTLEVYDNTYLVY